MSPTAGGGEKSSTAGLSAIVASDTPAGWTTASAGKAGGAAAARTGATAAGAGAVGAGAGAAAGADWTVRAGAEPSRMQVMIPARTTPSRIGRGSELRTS
ncbi:hypothetical protein ESZ53_05250 [Salinibacterium sp. UTAS2018]|nr:hypothetical protein ESZ53_05250 [Salinibacterium sp. UTAS2018]